jgi:hypothetical protein
MDAYLRLVVGNDYFPKTNDTASVIVANQAFDVYIVLAFLCARTTECQSHLSWTTYTTDLQWIVQMTDLLGWLTVQLHQDCRRLEITEEDHRILIEN